MVFVKLTKDSKGRSIVGVIFHVERDDDGGTMVYCCNKCEGEFDDLQNFVDHWANTANHTTVGISTTTTVGSPTKFDLIRSYSSGDA